jgi:hypothetical protein
MSAPGNANARREPGERAIKQSYARTLRASKRNVNKTYGPPELCGWQVARAVFWIQTTEPRFSRKLEKRADARRVEVDGINHYRRTFELDKGMRQPSPGRARAARAPRAGARGIVREWAAVVLPEDQPDRASSTS